MCLWCSGFSVPVMSKAATSDVLVPLRSKPTSFSYGTARSVALKDAAITTSAAIRMRAAGRSVGVAKSLFATSSRRRKVSSIAVHSQHSWLYSMLNAHSKKPQAAKYKVVMSVIIFANLLFFTLSTIPEYHERYRKFFYFEEVCPPAPALALLVCMFMCTCRCLGICMSTCVCMCMCTLGH